MWTVFNLLVVMGFMWNLYVCAHHMCKRNFWDGLGFLGIALCVFLLGTVVSCLAEGDLNTAVIALVQLLMVGWGVALCTKKASRRSKYSKELK